MELSPEEQEIAVADLRLYHKMRQTGYTPTGAEVILMGKAARIKRRLYLQDDRSWEQVDALWLSLAQMGAMKAADDGPRYEQDDQEPVRRSVFTEIPLPAEDDNIEN